jgi:hypothetical protein
MDNQYDIPTTVVAAPAAAPDINHLVYTEVL